MAEEDKTPSDEVSSGELGIEQGLVFPAVDKTELTSLRDMIQWYSKYDKYVSTSEKRQAKFRQGAGILFMLARPLETKLVDAALKNRERFVPAFEFESLSSTGWEFDDMMLALIRRNNYSITRALRHFVTFYNSRIGSNSYINDNIRIFGKYGAIAHQNPELGDLLMTKVVVVPSSLDQYGRVIIIVALKALDKFKELKSSDFIRMFQYIFEHICRSNRGLGSTSAQLHGCTIIINNLDKRSSWCRTSLNTRLVRALVDDPDVFPIKICCMIFIEPDYLSKFSLPKSSELFSVIKVYSKDLSVDPVDTMAVPQDVADELLELYPEDSLPTSYGGLWSTDNESMWYYNARKRENLYYQRKRIEGKV